MSSVIPTEPANANAIKLKIETLNISFLLVYWKDLKLE